MTHSYIWHYLHIVSKEAKRKQVISKITIMTLDPNNVNIEVVMQIHRSNRRRCSVRKDVLRNFTKFTRKHLCQSLLFLRKLQTFLQNTSGRLLLTMDWFLFDDTFGVKQIKLSAIVLRACNLLFIHLI